MKDFIKKLPSVPLNNYFIIFLIFIFALPCCRQKNQQIKNEELFTSTVFTPKDGFTSSIEGPAVDVNGTLFAVNFQRNSTIAKISAEGNAALFLNLPEGSTGNGIRFDSRGDMFIADYSGHNILKVDQRTHKITVFVHGPEMHQPNDLAIGANNIIFATDPDWETGTGQIWRIDPERRITLLETDMGTTNGIEVSPLENILYVNESVQRNVWAYDLSEDGSISNKRLFISFPDHGLDGMRCDSEGNLYITRYGKGTVVKVSAQGHILNEINLTGKKPSNIAFGGSDGRTCYITLQDQGNIEVFRVDTPGRSWLLWRR